MHDFRLIMIWDVERELNPEDFQYILRPEVAFERARVYYDLDSDNYSHFSLQQMPERKSGFINPFSVSMIVNIMVYMTALMIIHNTI